MKEPSLLTSNTIQEISDPLSFFHLTVSMLSDSNPDPTQFLTRQYLLLLLT